jgi:hypothetical protein
VRVGYRYIDGDAAAPARRERQQVNPSAGVGGEGTGFGTDGEACAAEESRD